MKRITIIGGGASGTLLAVNLARFAQGRIEVDLIEKRSLLGKGVAFGTTDDTHLLNVPACRMGGFHDNVGHFHQWLIENGHQYDANAFVPRRIFGKYLGDMLDRSSNHGSPVKLNIIDDEAIDLTIENDIVRTGLASGASASSEAAVLAFGNFSPPDPTVEDISFTRSKMYFRDPWQRKMYEAIDTDKTVLIIGTGLSMVDILMHFSKAGHRGKLFAISTRGLLPAVHKLGFTYPSFYDELKDLREITAILKTVRRHISIAAANGSDWRAVIDSLRPVTQQIWLDLPLAEQKYFKQHLSRYWNVARHRMPPEAADVLKDMQANGKLEILRGRLKRITYSADSGFETIFTVQGIEHSVTADALVNCIGSESNFSNIDSPLIKHLFHRGYIRNDALSFGLDATPDGSIIGADNIPSKKIHILGTALKGILWESTAIPEIRLQAHQLALKLLSA